MVKKLIQTKLFKTLAFLVVLLSAAASCAVEEDPAPQPAPMDTTSLISVTELTPYSAIVKGIFADDADSSSIVGLRFSLQNTRYLAATGDRVEGVYLGNGTHAVFIDNLYSDTTYYFRTFFSTGDEEHYSDVYSFRTHRLEAKTDSVKNVYAFGAQFGLTLSEEIDPAKFRGTYGVYYSNRPKVIKEYSILCDSTYCVDNLLPDYTYYYRAFVLMETAALRQVYIWGDIREFTTPAIDVHTFDATNVTPFAATLKGNVNVRFEDVDEMGFLFFDKNRDVTLDSVGQPSDQTILLYAPDSLDALGRDGFLVRVKDLKHDAYYHYRAYAKVRVIIGGVPYVRTIYGNVCRLRTMGYEVSEDDYVDLGLSVKWAGRNVGADATTDIGGYYTYEKRAQIPIGQGGRRPTFAECKELVDNCYWTWIKYKRVNGVVITGPNGKSIFMPANYQTGDAYTYGIYMQNDSVNIFADHEFVPSIRFVQDIAQETECGKMAENMIDLDAEMSVRLVKD